MALDDSSPILTWPLSPFLGLASNITSIKSLWKSYFKWQSNSKLIHIHSIYPFSVLPSLEHLPIPNTLYIYIFILFIVCPSVPTRMKVPWEQGILSALFMGFTGGVVVKNPPANADSIPGSGRSLGVGNCNPFHYSCLENPMDRGAWRVTIHGVSRSCIHDWTHTHLLLITISKNCAWNLAGALKKCVKRIIFK